MQLEASIAQTIDPQREGIASEVVLAQLAPIKREAKHVGIQPSTREKIVIPRKTLPSSMAQLLRNDNSKTPSSPLSTQIPHTVKSLRHSSRGRPSLKSALASLPMPSVLGTRARMGARGRTPTHRRTWDLPLQAWIPRTQRMCTLIATLR